MVIHQNDVKESTAQEKWCTSWCARMHAGLKDNRAQSHPNHMPRQVVWCKTRTEKNYNQRFGMRNQECPRPCTMVPFAPKTPLPYPLSPCTAAQTFTPMIPCSKHPRPLHGCRYNGKGPLSRVQHCSPRITPSHDYPISGLVHPQTSLLLVLLSFLLLLQMLALLPLLLLLLLLLPPLLHLHSGQKQGHKG